MADWKDIIKVVAPSIASVFGGPLAGSAVKQLGEVLLGKSDATEEELATVLNNGLSSDAIVKIKELDNNFQIQIKALTLESKKVDYQNEQSYLVDTQDARKNNASNHDVFTLGVGVLIIYAVILIAGLYGSFEIITGGIPLKDVATVGIVSTFIGSIIGSVGTQAGQVISFYFGSTKNSEKKTDQLADAFKNLK